MNLQEIDNEGSEHHKHSIAEGKRMQIQAGISVKTRGAQGRRIRNILFEHVNIFSTHNSA